MRIRLARNALATWLVMVLVAACQPKSPADRLESQASQFVKLALSLGEGERAKEVDAYFGPAELDPRGKGKPVPLAELLDRARALQAEMAKEPVGDELAPRAQALARQLQQFIALLEVITADPRVPFVDEAQRLYGISVPRQEDPNFKGKVGKGDTAVALLKQLDELLPGAGPVAFRVGTFLNQHIVPADKRQAVFERALQECRRRTLLHWQLPDHEQLKLEWTRDVPAAWHTYQGNGQGLLRVNTAAIAYAGTQLDLACHEGYPGHQAQFAMREAAAGAAGLPIEDKLVLLRSPASVLREGAANHAAEFTFTPEERVAFERDVLFPLAGLPAADAEKYFKMHRLLDALSLTVLPILRDYRDGSVTYNSGTYALGELLIPSPEPLLKFTDEVGAYVVGYTLVREQVRDYLQNVVAETGEDPWIVLGRLVTQLDPTVLSTSGPRSAP